MAERSISETCREHAVNLRQNPATIQHTAMLNTYKDLDLAQFYRKALSKMQHTDKNAFHFLKNTLWWFGDTLLSDFPQELFLKSNHFQRFAGKTQKQFILTLRSKINSVEVFLLCFCFGIGLLVFVFSKRVPLLSQWSFLTSKVHTKHCKNQADFCLLITLDSKL